ncbi:MAG: hypothetical protein LBV79_05690 [Candidatus Adiutrix sp.]|jgi:exopolyphosphatase/guanosine-5'-triphosphate,3'-diphosphate pyrophosphatase|nr:hypothetical protein [Candidatus Adiutrix sp.]
MQVESIAAIDIGSNAIRLLINNVEDFDAKKAVKKNAYIRVPVRLGEDVFQSGRIGEDKIGRLMETMRAFVHLMHVFNVNGYRACATSAMREAANGAEVVKLVKEKAGLDIDLVTGPEEADLIYAAGSLDEVMDKDKSYLHVDVGGGSTELVVYCDHKKKDAFSFPIGTLRELAEAVNPATRDELKKTLKLIYERYAPVDIIASGGNINKTLKLLGKRDGEAVDYNSVENFYRILAKLSIEERLEKYKMNSYRADVIVPALDIFLTIGAACKVKNYIIPKVGLVDGIIRMLYSGQMKPRKTPDKKGYC